jgi:hypothetical protein
MEREPTTPVGRSNIDVESLSPEQRREDESERQDCEEREPIMNVSAPLRYSQAASAEEAGNGSRRENETPAISSSSSTSTSSLLQVEDNVRPL